MSDFDRYGTWGVMWRLLLALTLGMILIVAMLLYVMPWGVP